MAGAAFVGLLLGVAALVVSVSLLSGFQGHIRRRLMAETPHLVVEPAGRAAFRADEGVAAALGRIPGVAAVAPVVRGRIWLAFGGRAVPAPAVGRENAVGVVLDPGLAGPIGAFPGDELTLVSARTRLSPLGPVPIVATAALTSLAPPGAGRRAPEAVLPLADARRLFLVEDGGATGYEVRLSKPETAPDVAARVRARLGPGAVARTWEEANRALVAALRLERIVLFATVFLIVVVAGLNLAATSAVLAATRARDAALLQVMGGARRTVARVFLVAGAAVGLAGTAAGLLLGATVALALDRFQLVPLPGAVFALTHVPFRLDLADLAAIGGLSVVWSVVAAAVPANAAARVDLTEALRG